MTALASMTGFARAEGALGDFSWAWEIKSVNGRSLDIRCRLANGFDILESVARQALGRRIKRGNLSVSLTVNDEGAKGRLTVNETAFEQILDLIAGLERRSKIAPPRLDGLLALKGVLEIEAPETEPDVLAARRRAIEESLEAAIATLAEMRRAEGARLLPVIEGHLAEIERLTESARALATAQPEAIRLRLRRQIEELTPGDMVLDPARLAQEIALLAARCDVREELDRLAAHAGAARALLSGEEAAGRKLDFLCQELNREANTLCSKAADLDLTRLGLDLKATIEQLREQSQNIE